MPKKTAVSASHQSAGCQMVESGPLGSGPDQERRGDERGDHEDDDRDAHPGVDSSGWGVDPARAALAALAASLA